MSDVIISALIAASATIIAALIGEHFLYKKRTENYKSSIGFLKENDNYKDLLHDSRTCCMYTVNSYELLNELNLLLERNEEICLNEVNILVRKKHDETVEDINSLNSIIDLWKRLFEKGKIRKLSIIGYDHDPDHYYTIIDDKVVFCGQVLFDKTKPTGTTIEYVPLVILGKNEVEKRIIKNYQNHFDNVVEKYKEISNLCSL